MLNISFEGSDVRVVEVLQSKGPQIIQVLTTKLNQLMLQLRSYIVSSKLSGQYLKRRTGILAGSVNVVPATFQGTQIVAGVEAGSGPAFYGKFYEEISAGGTGGTAAFQVFATKARALAFMMDGKRVFARSVMHPAMATRPFMTSALEEKAAEIEAGLRAAVDGVVNES